MKEQKNNIEKARIQLTCSKCNHVWKTKSTLFYVSCPSCLFKVKNIPLIKYLEKKMENKIDMVN